MMKFISLLAIAFSLNVWADPSSPSQLKPPSVPTIDLMTNGSFEAGKASYTVSGPGGSTFSIDSSAPLNGKASGSFTSSAASQILSSPQYTIKEGLKGGACAASVFYKTTEGTNKYTFRVVDGSSNVLASDTLGPVSAGQPKALYFQCPSSGTIAAQVISSGTAAAVKLDDITLGKNNLIQISQATWLGSLSMDQATGCQWSSGTSSWASFLSSPASGCNAPVVGGNAVSAGKVPAVTFNNLSPGEYLVSVNAPVQANAGLVSCSYRIFDGSTAVAQNVYSTANAVTMSGHYTYTGAQSTKTFELQTYDEAGSDACVINLSNLGTNATLTWNVYKFPSQVEQAVRPETINWKVDATLTGTGGNRVGLGSVNVASLTGMGDSTLSLANNSGAMAAQIPCDSTNPPTGTTCAAGTPQVGVNFNVPAAGDVQACVNFNWISSAGAGAQAQPYFTIVETPSNAQTILQQIPMTATPLQLGATGGNTLGIPLRLCGRIPLASSGNKTLRLFYKQVASGSPSSELYISPDAPITWEVHPVTQNVPAPVLVNQPVAFHASSATPTISSAFPHGGTGAHVIFSSLGTEGYDTNSGLNLTTGFYSIPVAGLWTFTATTAISSTYDVGYEADAFIMKNGTVVSNGVARWSGVSTASTLHPTTTVTVFCSVGDQISFDADTNSSGSFGSSAGRNYFEGHLIR